MDKKKKWTQIIVKSKRIEEQSLLMAGIPDTNRTTSDRNPKQRLVRQKKQFTKRIQGNERGLVSQTPETKRPRDWDLQTPIRGVDLGTQRMKHSVRWAVLARSQVRTERNRIRFGSKVWSGVQKQYAIPIQLD